MKKLMALCLAMLMALSMVSFSVMAEEEAPVYEEPVAPAEEVSAFDEYPAAPQPVRPMHGQRVFGEEADIPEAPVQPARRSYNNDVPAFLRRKK